MAKFNLNDLLNSQSKQEAAPKQEFTRQIPIEQIVPAENNAYGIRDIAELAASIESLGLLHNLVVRQLENGNYELISGERRYRACRMLHEQGNTIYATLPCKVESRQDGNALTELKLLYANATARVLTDYEKTYQAQRIKELLTQMKREGYAFKGRLRDAVAEMLDVPTGQVARMDCISQNLIPELKEEFKEGKIGISAAYEASTLPSVQQQEALQEYRKEGTLKAVHKGKSKEHEEQALIEALWALSDALTSAVDILAGNTEIWVSMDGVDTPGYTVVRLAAEALSKRK